MELRSINWYAHIVLILTILATGCSATACNTDKSTTPQSMVEGVLSPLATPTSHISPLSPPSIADIGPVSGHIAFHSNRFGNFDIFVMDPDGTNQQCLTSDSADDVEPAWSPEGTQIAFASKRDGDFEIFVMDSEGTNQTQLTHNNCNDWAPTWSSDGNSLAFVSDCDGTPRLYLMDSSGSNRRALAEPGVGDGWAPDWSPNGDLLVFVSNRTGNSELYLITPQGKLITQLTDNNLQDERPSWSPDGTQIVYMGASTNTSLIDPDEIWLLSPKGGTPQRLTDNTVGDITPNWSPDGKWIVFSSEVNGDWEICLLRPDGSGESHCFTGVIGWDREPDWGP